MKVKPEIQIGGIVVIITMPKTDKVIGTIDKESICNELAKTCNKIKLDGPFVDGVYTITVDCTWRNLGARVALVKKLVEKYYNPEQEDRV